MDIRVLAHTKYNPEVLQDLHGFEPDPESTDAATLAEAAGRSCYMSFDRPNPMTANNDDYLANVIKQGHLSVLEHGAASLLFTGVSRSLTHELVRHRHLSYSMLSQRYCPNTEGYVVPPLYGGEEEWQTKARVWLENMWTRSSEAYEELVSLAQNAGVPRKQAREAARAVLPNMTATQIMVSGNHRSWREFVQKRATVHADAEIRRAAVEVFRLLSKLEPNLYQDARVEVAYKRLAKPEIVVWS